MTTPEPIDVEATKTRIAAMVATNDAAIRTLAQQGVGINVEAVRLMALVEYLFGDNDDPRRLAYELHVQQKFETAIAEVSAQMQAAITRSRLLEGVNGAAMPKLPGRP